MKKLILSSAFAALSMLAFAQKPTAGSKTAEVNFTGAGLNSFSYTTPELRFRHFATDNMAYRLRVNLGMSSTTDKENTGGVDVERKASSGFGLTIAPGIEKHFAGTAKLSPYYGAQLNLGFETASSVDYTNALGGGPGAWAGVASGNKASSKSGSTLGVGIGAFMGADYYITDGVYVGGEFGLGLFNFDSTGEGEESETVGGTTTTTKSGTSSTLELFGVTSGGVRLGFRF
jgi:outer membrane protein W